METCKKLPHTSPLATPGTLLRSLQLQVLLGVRWLAASYHADDVERGSGRSLELEGADEGAMNAAREVLHLSRALLGGELPRAVLPAGVRITSWSDGSAPVTHALLVAAYRYGGGAVDPYEEWLIRFSEDPEFEPSSCFLAWNGNELVGASLCWSSAFVKDLCVAEHYRRRGLGSCLLALTMAHFRERGASSLELRAHADNPSGANQLYRKLGFVRLET